MGLRIEDGQGSGKSVGVNSYNHLKVAAISRSIEHWVNHALGRAHTATFETSASAGGNCIFYIKNNDTSRDLTIEGLHIYASKSCELYCKLNDEGTPTSVTALTPVNLNTGSGISPDVNLYYGTGIGGLSGGDEMYRIKFIAETATAYYNFEQDIILDNNGVFTIYADTDANFIISVDFHQHIAG